MDIQCVDFELRSSQAVQRLRLNERVRFAVTTNFSCEGAAGAGARARSHAPHELPDAWPRR